MENEYILDKRRELATTCDDRGSVVVCYMDVELDVMIGEVW